MSSIKIIKRVSKERDEVDQLETRSIEKTRQQNTREIATTVKTWIAEWEQHRRTGIRTSNALHR